MTQFASLKLAWLSELNTISGNVLKVSLVNRSSTMNFFIKLSWTNLFLQTINVWEGVSFFHTY